MTKDEIIAKLKESMSNSVEIDVNWDSVSEQTKIESLGFDSLSILDLIYDIQQVFGLDFEAEEMVGVDTVGALADFLKARLDS